VKSLIRILIVVGFFAFCVYAYRDVTSRRIDDYTRENTRLSAELADKTKVLDNVIKSRNEYQTKYEATLPKATVGTPATQPNK